jgi:hemoglobin/transferrin/lactoferrin receptor protein
VLKIVLTLTVFVFLATTAAEPAEIETEPLKVTVTRIEQEVAEIPMTTGIITEDEIRRNPQSSIADQLNNIPGIIVQDGAMAGGKRVSIRGESSSRAVIMIDGVRISEQKSMSGAAILMDTNDIERIEVIKGPSSVLYGSDALAGVVNIITKKGGAKPFGGSVKMTYDSSSDLFAPYLSLNGTEGGFNYRVSAAGITSGDRHTPDGVIDKTSYEQRHYSANAGYDWSNASVSLKTDYFDNDISIPDTKYEDIYENVFSRVAIEMDLPEWKRWTNIADVKFTNLTDNLVKLNVNGFYQNLTKDFKNHINVHNLVADTQLVDVRLHTENDQNSFGGHVTSEWLFFDDHYAITGVDYNRDDLSARTHSITSMGSDSIKRHEGTMDMLGVFGQDEWSITDFLKLNLGLRWTYIKSELTKGENDINAVEGSETKQNTVGNIGMVISPLDGLAVRAMFSQGYKVATLSELYIGTSGHGGATTLPNPDLYPEKSVNYETGILYTNGGFSLDAAIYYTDAKNYITTRNLGRSSNYKQYVNMDKAHTLGFEMGTEYAFASLTPYLVFNYIRREVENNGVKSGRTGVPPVQAKGGLRWQGKALGHTFFTDINCVYASEAKYDGEDVTTKASYDPWATLNMTVGFEGGGRISYFGNIAVRNIFNEEYSYALSTLPEAGIHVAASAGVNF